MGLEEEDGSCEMDSTLGFLGCRMSHLITGSEDSAWYKVADLLWHGLEEFEEKIDKIAEGQEDDENSWISKIYHQFSFFNDGDNSLSETDLEGLEPPLLDETWGLGVRTIDSANISANATVEAAVKLEDEEDSLVRSTRSAEDEEEEDTEEKCRVDLWRCLSQVIEGGLHYIEHPEGLVGLAKKTMFKMAFHGGSSNVWGGLMGIPEARRVKHCMTDHTECVSYEILRREAQETMDPEDPDYSMYQKKMTQRKKHVTAMKQEQGRKKERLIINPEFVENQDVGDGSVPYDEEYHNEV